jgi:hypothetical protein
MVDFTDGNPPNWQIRPDLEKRANGALESQGFKALPAQVTSEDFKQCANMIPGDLECTVAGTRLKVRMGKGIWAKLPTDGRAAPWAVVHRATAPYSSIDEVAFICNRWLSDQNIKRHGQAAHQEAIFTHRPPLLVPGWKYSDPGAPKPGPTMSDWALGQARLASDVTGRPLGLALGWFRKKRGASQAYLGSKGLYPEGNKPHFQVLHRSGVQITVTVNRSAEWSANRLAQIDQECNT